MESMMKRNTKCPKSRSLGVWWLCAAMVGTAFVFGAGQSEAAERADPRDQRIADLERIVNQLVSEVKTLKKGSQTEQIQSLKQEERFVEIEKKIETAGTGGDIPADSWVSKFDFGGYGEMHANFGGGQDDDLFDIHRLVLYMGYEFNSWIKFHSETEIEHAFVGDGAGGELAIEQAYVDFLFTKHFNIRAGRVLTPLGLINRKHEPNTFNGVERPNFAKYIIPSTWSSDGIGIFGEIIPSLKYEAYVVAGLDGSKFSATNGIRSGRIKERPSFNEIALTGRLDWFPIASRDVPHNQTLRLGLSAYVGGVENGNNAKNPNVDGTLRVFSGDVEYTIGKLDFRGVIALDEIDGAINLGSGTATEIFGWYAETAYHIFPEAWKRGKTSKADAMIFARFDAYDTQHDMPGGATPNKSGDREEWTFGITFLPVPNFAIKADYQIRQDDTTHELDNKLNLGMGWQF